MYSYCLTLACILPALHAVLMSCAFVVGFFHSQKMSLCMCFTFSICTLQHLLVGPMVWKELLATGWEDQQAYNYVGVYYFPCGHPPGYWDPCVSTSCPKLGSEEDPDTCIFLQSWVLSAGLDVGKPDSRNREPPFIAGHVSFCAQNKDAQNVLWISP